MSYEPLLSFSGMQYDGTMEVVVVWRDDIVTCASRQRSPHEFQEKSLPLPHYQASESTGPLAIKARIV